MEYRYQEDEFICLYLVKRVGLLGVILCNINFIFVSRVMLTRH